MIIWRRGLMSANAYDGLFKLARLAKEIAQRRRQLAAPYNQNLLALLLTRSTALQLPCPPGGIARKIFSGWLAAVLLVLTFGQFAAAQDKSETEAALRIEQQKLFEQLQAHPDDLDVMFAYAVVSVRARDYEPAIATLERMLIYNNDLPRVKLELGSAYFRLGSYEVSRFYFNEAIAGSPPPDVKLKVEEFLAEIERRTKQNAFSGLATFGVVYSTNANLGATDRQVEVFGLDALLDQEFVKADDVGLSTSLRLSHVYDLQKPNDDVWITEGSFAALRFLEETDGDLDALLIKTGPRLALTDASYGPKLRPFIRAGYIRSGGEFLYVSGGGGVDYLNTLDADTSLFASFGARYRDFTSDRNTSDGLNVYATIGSERQISTGTTLRGTVFGSRESANASFESYLEAGGRIGAGYTYAPEISDVLQEPWTLSAFAQVSGRWYDDPDAAVNPNVTRHDFDVRVGISHLFRIADGWSLSIDSSYFERGSNLRNFELNSFEVGAFIGKSF